MTWEKVLAKVCQRFEQLGSKKLSDGTRLVGHVPHIGSEAYLFELFPGLGPTDLRKLAASAGRQIPKELAKFYGLYNGMHLFAGALSIDGFRKSYAREGDGKRAPFGIEVPNVDERINSAPDEAVFFGFYDWDGSQLAVLQDSPAVLHIPANEWRVLRTWRNLDELLTKEINRLAAMFNEDGKRTDPEEPTSPGF